MGYHLNVKVVSRGGGHSVIAKAAYNAREKILEQRTGETKDYTRAGDRPLWSGIFAGRDAPQWVQDRAQFWNEADRAEKRKDAQLAYNFIGSLPHQLTDQQREYIVKDFAREQFLRRGVVADVNIHRPDPKGDDRNYHVHMLVTMREITPEGFGKRVLNWQDREQNLERWREKWAERGARELEKAGLHMEAERWRVGHLDLERQREAALERCDLAHAEKLNREATKHRGPQIDAMERKGIETDRGVIYRDTVDRNEAIAPLRAQLDELNREISKTLTREADMLNLSHGGRDVWMARQISDDARSFSSALAERGIALAQATKHEARESEVDYDYFERKGRYTPRLREGEIVAVTEHGQVFKLSERHTGHEFAETQRFLKALMPELHTVTETKAAQLQAAEMRQLERELFQAVSGVGLLDKGDGITIASLGRETGSAVEQMATAIVGALDSAGGGIGDAAGAIIKGGLGGLELIGQLSTFFGGGIAETPKTREQILGIIERQEQRHIDYARFRSDDDYRRQVEFRTAQRIDAAREQRRFYEQQWERERER